MTKRTRETSAHTPRKPDRENGVLEDWCSGLPDDILVNIISRLCLREAARTSVLSTRWKYLWTFITVLNFDSSMNLCKVGRMMSTVDSEEKKTNYINWVNHVLDLHRGSKIKDFKVYVQLFDIDSHTRAITNWFNIAIAKRVENLDLILGIVGRGCTFPHEECISNLKSPHDLSNIKSLKSISLREVGVNSETLEFFIYNCPLLERLYVRRSEDLSGRLKIVGSSLRLKYLEIICCYSLEEIELSAPSLLSYKYHGKLIKFSIENVPLLVDVALGGTHDIELSNLVDPFINYLHQLESLELNMDVEKMPLPFWELPNLRYLTLQVTADDGKNFLELTNMIKACPYLHKFTLKLIYKRGRMFNKRRRKEIREFPKCPDQHQHLKVVEFIGFVGRPIDLELGFYLLENATMLEKMIINPRNPLLLEHYMHPEDSKKERDARRRAKRQLEDKVPQRVEFVVL